MIKALWCLIWGHSVYTEVFTGNYGYSYSPLHGESIKVPIVRKVQNDGCPRCGKVF